MNLFHYPILKKMILTLYNGIYSEMASETDVDTAFVHKLVLRIISRLIINDALGTWYQTPIGKKFLLNGGQKRKSRRSLSKSRFSCISPCPFPDLTDDSEDFGEP